MLYCRKNGVNIVRSLVLTEREKDSGCMHKNTLTMGRHFFDVSGFLKIENVFSPDLIETWRRAHEERPQGLARGTEISNKRYIIPISVEGPFDTPLLYDNPLIMPLMKALLGDDCIIGSLGVVTALPGAEEQHLHADFRLPFPENPSLSCALPTYAVTFAIPLTDIDCLNGPTKIWEGSHKTYPIDAKMESYRKHLLYGPRGSCYFWDYRTFHAGGPNYSDRMRSLLYISYTRSWFKDFFNPELLTMNDLVYQNLSEERKKLFLSLRDKGKEITKNYCQK